jgi:hypothetical protein
MVADVYPGPGGGPLLLGLVGTDLIFASNTSDKTWQIFRTDGTSAGTVALSNFPASSYGILNESVAVNGKIYMSLDKMNICCQPDLWVTDGTTAGTHQIGASTSQYHVEPSSFAVFGNSILFTGGDPNTGGNVLYILDPTSDTIQILAGAQFNSSYQSSIAVMNGFALFVGVDSSLWRTDGTVAGTSKVKDIGLTTLAGRLGSQDTQLLRVGDRAIFQGDDGVHGAYIWSSDGTDQGTVPLIPAHAYPNLGPQTMLGTVGTHGYFAVNNSPSAGGGDWRYRELTYSPTLVPSTLPTSVSTRSRAMTRSPSSTPSITREASPGVCFHTLRRRALSRPCATVIRLPTTSVRCSMAATSSSSPSTQSPESSPGSVTAQLPAPT